MKKLFYIFCLTLFIFNYFTAQNNYNSDFLDGTIVFKLKDFVLPFSESKDTSNDGIGLIENISKYPEIENIFKNANVLKFERPSYFTNKRNLQKIYRIKFSDNEKIDFLISELSKLNSIEYAEKEPVYKTTFIPNDTYHNGTDKWYHNLVNSEQAWDYNQGNQSIKIAVVDNAIATQHADLSVFKQRDVADGDNDTNPPEYFSSDQQGQSWSHGTHCAGLATAQINNSTGITSIGGNVQLIAVKSTGDSQNPDNTYFGYDGVQWACENGANVVSMSYGSSNSSNAMQSLISSYPNIVFLGAAGNSGTTDKTYPAAYMGVIGVGSVNTNDTRSSFSNYNTSVLDQWVDIASPGGFSFGGLLSSVYTPDLNGYGYKGGTSMATPFAAGLVGLMLSVNPSLTPTEILQCLSSSGANINQNIGRRIDAYAAVICAQPENDNPIPAFTASPVYTIENQPVNFVNNSVQSDSWSWIFEGGTPSTYEGENPPNITYSNYGQYDVTLTVSNSFGEQTITKEDYINVFNESSGEWILQNSTFNNQSTGINYISIANENIAWATAYNASNSGTNIQQFTKTVNGGDTWEFFDIDVGDSNLGISMIHAYDENIAWLVAFPYGAGQTGGIFKTQDGGNNWTRQNSANYNSSESFANVVYFWDENTGFAQGDPIGGEFELYVTANGGDNWNPVPGSAIPNPIFGEYGYTRQIEVVGNSVWFTTNNGRIYHSTDKGNNWSVYNSPIEDFGSAQISGNLSFKDSQNGIIISSRGDIYKSSNAGQTWQQIETTGPIYTSGLCYIEGTDIVFSTGGGSSFSDDGGFSWSPIDEQPHLYVDFYNEQLGWSGGFTQVSGGISTGGVWKWEDFSLSNSEYIIDNMNIRYFPNPTNDIVNILYENEIEIEIFNINGKKILETNDKKIDLSGYSNGLYFIKINDIIKNKVKHIKIIKE